MPKRLGFFDLYDGVGGNNPNTMRMFDYDECGSGVSRVFCKFEKVVRAW